MSIGMMGPAFISRPHIRHFKFSSMRTSPLLGHPDRLWSFQVSEARGRLQVPPAELVLFDPQLCVLTAKSGDRPDKCWHLTGGRYHVTLMVGLLRCLRLQQICECRLSHGSGLLFHQSRALVLRLLLNVVAGILVPRSAHVFYLGLSVQEGVLHVVRKTLLLFYLLHVREIRTRGRALLGGQFKYDIPGAAGATGLYTAAIS